MPDDVLEVTTKFMVNPIRILVKKEELTLEGIKQFYVNVEKEVSNNYLLICQSHWWPFLHHHLNRVPGLNHAATILDMFPQSNNRNDG